MQGDSGSCVHKPGIISLCIRADIPAIDLNRCFGGLDFGRGFYLTSSYEQAYNYVQLSVRKAMRIGTVPRDFNPEDGQISVYKFHYDPNILAYCFQGASVEWLHFVAANRKKDLFPQLLKKYGTIDSIGGKIANDQTAHVEIDRYNKRNKHQSQMLLSYLQ